MERAGAAPWVEKYRPETIDQVIGHCDIITTLKAFVSKGQLPHILLYGPPGTGKTSVVQAIVRAICGDSEDYRVLELNASDDRGIQTVRERIKVFADASFVRNDDQDNPPPNTAQSGAGLVKVKEDQEATAAAPPAVVPDTAIKQEKKNPPNLNDWFKKKPSTNPPPPPPPPVEMADPFASRPKSASKRRVDEVVVSEKLRNIKIIVLDEVDQMTNVAQTALRRIMERYAAHVRFFLMCNDVHKINLPIQSRCCRFHFSPVPQEFMKTKLLHVIKQEQVQIEPAAIDELVSLSAGDFRRLLNTLQACAMASNVLTTTTTTTTSDPLAVAAAAAAHDQAMNDGQRIITVDVVRRSLGLPDVSEIKDLIQTLKEKTFQQALNALIDLILAKGYSLVDIVDSCYHHLIASEITDRQAMTIIPRLAEIKSVLAIGGSLTVQAACLVASFTELKPF